MESCIKTKKKKRSLFGELVQRELDRRGWTVAYLASQTTYRAQSISYAMSGATIKPGNEMIFQVAKALELDPKLLFDACAVAYPGSDLAADGESPHDARRDAAIQQYIEIANKFAEAPIPEPFRPTPGEILRLAFFSQGIVL